MNFINKFFKNTFGILLYDVREQSGEDAIIVLSKDDNLLSSMIYFPNVLLMLIVHIIRFKTLKNISSFFRGKVYNDKLRDKSGLKRSVSDSRHTYGLAIDTRNIDNLTSFPFIEDSINKTSGYTHSELELKIFSNMTIDQKKIVYRLISLAVVIILKKLYNKWRTKNGKK